MDKIEQAIRKYRDARQKFRELNVVAFEANCAANNAEREKDEAWRRLEELIKLES